MTIDNAKDYLREHWPNIRSQLLEGIYQPLPLKQVEITQAQAQSQMLFHRGFSILERNLKPTGRRMSAQSTRNIASVDFHGT
jgi:hypothetical protein